MDAFFRPRTVAVIGASEKEGSVGHAILSNLLEPSFGGRVFPVNPKRSTLLGRECFKRLADVPERCELAVIATPAVTVPDVVGECVDAGVKAAIIISAGFKELGEKGAALEHSILERVKGSPLRLVGPNCLGVMAPGSGMNATFARTMAVPGSVAFLSQSGALCTAVLDWSFREKVGFSAFASLGSMLDVGWGDLIDYLSDDPATKSILIYMETVGDARRFLSAARECALSKPIIVLKAGRTEAAAKAAASHTGSIAGSDQVLDAAFRRCGVLRVNEIRELFDMADILAKQPRPQGPKLMVLTNAGGPGVLATDALIQSGGELATLSEPVRDRLDSFLPSHWSRVNPVDILGDATPERYERAFKELTAEKDASGYLVVLTPQAMSDPTAAAEKIAAIDAGGKPVLASWMGGSQVDAGRSLLAAHNIPVIDYPDEAARLFDYMWRYQENLRQLYETPVLSRRVVSSRKACDVVDHLLNKERAGTILSEAESKSVLGAYGIPVIPTPVAATVDQAVQLAEQTGYPVVLKLHSEIITHKADAGGVRLSISDEASVRRAFAEIRRSAVALKGEAAFLGVSVQPMIEPGGYELILGCSEDPQFGPVLLFGAGGRTVEIFRDVELGLPPLNSTLARRLMERTRIFEAMRKGGRVDLDYLGEVLVRFSQLVAERPRIREIDINPFYFSERRALALDARVILHEPSRRDACLPRTAIRPYPSEYCWHDVLPSGTEVVVRPIRPEDEPAMVRFHRTLSPQSIRLRYFGAVGIEQRIAHERLVRVCFNDYERELALVAEDPASGEGSRVLGVARLIRDRWGASAEFSLLVGDPYQGRGVGNLLFERALQVAKKEGIRSLEARTLPDNAAMLHLLAKHDFRTRHDAQEGLVVAVKQIAGARASGRASCLT